MSNGIDTVTGVSPGSYPATVPVPTPGSSVLSSDVTEAVMGLANQTAWLEAGKAALAGAVFTGPVVAPVGSSINGDVTIPAGKKLSVQGRSRRRPRVILGDDNHTLDTAWSDRFELPGAVFATRIIKLLSVAVVGVTPAPDEGETITLCVPTTGTATAILYSVEREDGTVICTLLGALLTGMNITAEFEFNAGVWRLGMNTGRSLDGSGNTSGVVPHAGA